MFPSVPGSPAVCGCRGLEAAVRLRNHAFHASNCCAAPTILSGDYIRLASAYQNLRKIFERTVGMYIRNRFAVDNQRRAGLGTPADLYHVTMQFRTSYFQHHVLALA